MRRSRLSTMFFLALLAVLVYSLYVVLGGDTTFLRNMGRATGTGSFLDSITSSLSALGQGLTDVFTRILP